MFGSLSYNEFSIHLYDTSDRFFSILPQVRVHNLNEVRT